MPNLTRMLRAICVCVPLVLAAACRDEEPSPVPPEPPPRPTPSGAVGVPSPAAPSEAQDGERLFTTYCVSCHGPTGSGDGPLAATLTPKPRNFRAGEFKFDTNADGKAGTVDDLANVIQNGAARYGGSPLMAGFPTLPETQIRELASYVQGLSGATSSKGG